MRKVVALVITLCVVLGAQYMAWQSRSAVSVTRVTLAGNPVDRYAAVGEPKGVVLVAHGFAGSKELMRPWGYYLARQGFTAYLFDQPGHGSSDRVLPAWQGSDSQSLGDNLLAMVRELIATGQAREGQVALVGHSMGGATVTAAALDDPSIRATAVISSAYSLTLPPDRPGNFLALAADRDLGFMVQAVRAMATEASSGKGELGRQYGDFAWGTARKADIVEGRNHITILYDETVMASVGDWLHRSFGSKPPAQAGASEPWLWTLLALLGATGVVLVTGAMLAPRTEYRQTGSQPRPGLTTGLIITALAALSSVLASVYLRLPWFGMAVVDYLIPYFLVMAAVFFALRLLWPRDYAFPLSGADYAFPAVARGAAVFLGFLGAFGPVIHMNLSGYLPTTGRILPMAGLTVVMWAYLMQEEALKRSIAGASGPLAAAVVGLAGKAFIVLTWLGGSALPNPQPFLPLVVPVMVVLMLVLELFSIMLGQWKYSAVAAATFSALVLAWTTAVTFPLI